MGSFAKSFKDLDVYTNAMEIAMEIFQLTKGFPKEETYSLTDQIRRSSRSVCANIGEAWRKRRYKAAFIAKLSDIEAEATETQVWIEIATRCGYIEKSRSKELDERYEKIISQIVSMLKNADSWLIK